ncbi:hypothetical protein NA57DRAFT_59639 [Rhizodiscina lignyota]|uniref:Uncharacterized protein n=1 Tax=Rhizodiscina lignyota TaxID=1504668 RepID=A0A9P4M3F0_9PEZI|nr:hypothetical protein NA57DRAFT_59639 [Rhizodiscina lignyota]
MDRSLHNSHSSIPAHACVPGPPENDIGAEQGPHLDQTSLVGGSGLQSNRPTPNSPSDGKHPPARSERFLSAYLNVHPRQLLVYLDALHQHMCYLSGHAHEWVEYMPTLDSEVRSQFPGLQNRALRRHWRDTLHRDATKTIFNVLFACEHIKAVADAVWNVLKAPFDERSEALRHVQLVLDEEIDIDHIGGAPFNINDLLAVDVQSNDDSVPRAVRWDHLLSKAFSLISSQPFRDLNSSPAARARLLAQLNEAPNIPIDLDTYVVQLRPIGWTIAHDALLVEFAVTHDLPGTWQGQFLCRRNQKFPKSWLCQRLRTLDFAKFDPPPGWNGGHVSALLEVYEKIVADSYNRIFKGGARMPVDIGAAEICPEPNTFYESVRSEFGWTGQRFVHDGYKIEKDLSCGEHSATTLRPPRGGVVRVSVLWLSWWMMTYIGAVRVSSNMKPSRTSWETLCDAWEDRMDILR